MMLEDKTNTEEIKEEKLGLELSDVKDHNVNDGVTDEVFFDDEDDGADEEKRKNRRAISPLRKTTGIFWLMEVC